MRGTVYVFLPLSIVFGLVLISQGVIQNLSPYTDATTLEGAKQTIAHGAGGLAGGDQAARHQRRRLLQRQRRPPLREPDAVHELPLDVHDLRDPVGAHLHLRPHGARTSGTAGRSGARWRIIFFAGVVACYHFEAQGNPALAGLPVDQSIGNMEGKEARFGVSASALYATVTTDASCGAVNSMHDSFTPLGGLVPLANIQLGEVVFGGTGAGLYGMLIYVVLTVFIAGLMVGRTPEYLGKKIESKEMKLAMLYVLIFPLVILGFTAWSAVKPYGQSSLNNAGPHGLMEILYAYSSGAGNNGSAYAGLNANTPWYNVTLGITMLVGRFLMIVPALGIAGSMVGKKIVPPSLGTFPTNGATFAVLLVSVVIIVGALTFFPALSLGNIIEHFAAIQRKGLLVMFRPKAQALSLFDRDIVRRAIIDSLRKLAPQHVAKNPVMFVVEIGSILTTLIFFRDLLHRQSATSPLWFTGAGHDLALVHGDLRQLRRGGRRGARQGAGRHSPPDAQGDHRAAAGRRRRGQGGGGPVVVAAQGRPGGRRGGAAHPRRRRDRRGHRLGRRVGDHR